MINHTISKKEAVGLFEMFAVLIGDRDVVPEFKAVELFGEDAVKFRPIGRNSYWLDDDRHANYVTLKGFLTAATYRNVEILNKGVYVFEDEGRNDEK